MPYAIVQKITGCYDDGIVVVRLLLLLVYVSLHRISAGILPD